MLAVLAVVAIVEAKAGSKGQSPKPSKNSELLLVVSMMTQVYAPNATFS